MNTPHEPQPPRDDTPAPPNGDGHLKYLITAYLFDNLSDEGRVEVETHLEECVECRAEFEELQATRALLEDALEGNGNGAEKSGAESSSGGGASSYSFEAHRLERVLAAGPGQAKIIRRITQWGSAAAAAVVICGVVAFLLRPQVLSARKSASRIAYPVAPEANPGADGWYEHSTVRANSIPSRSEASAGLDPADEGETFDSENLQSQLRRHKRNPPPPPRAPRAASPPSLGVAFSNDDSLVSDVQVGGSFSTGSTEAPPNLARYLPTEPAASGVAVSFGDVGRQPAAGYQFEGGAEIGVTGDAAGAYGGRVSADKVGLEVQTRTLTDFQDSARPNADPRAATPANERIASTSRTRSLEKKNKNIDVARGVQPIRADRVDLPSENSIRVIDGDSRTDLSIIQDQFGSLNRPSIEVDGTLRPAEDARWGQDHKEVAQKPDEISESDMWSRGGEHGSADTAREESGADGFAPPAGNSRPEPAKIASDATLFDAPIDSNGIPVGGRSVGTSTGIASKAPQQEQQRAGIARELLEAQQQIQERISAPSFYGAELLNKDRAVESDQLRRLEEMRAGETALVDRTTALASDLFKNSSESRKDLAGGIMAGKPADYGIDRDRAGSGESIFLFGRKEAGGRGGGGDATPRLRGQTILSNDLAANAGTSLREFKRKEYDPTQKRAVDRKPEILEQEKSDPILRVKPDHLFKKPGGAMAQQPDDSNETLDPSIFGRAAKRQLRGEDLDLIDNFAADPAFEPTLEDRKKTEMSKQLGRESEETRASRRWSLARPDGDGAGVDADSDDEELEMEEESFPIAETERALRAFSYYRQNDPDLDRARFFKNRLDIPAPEVGDEGLGREGFREAFGVTPFVETERDAQSTFALDVDTASYTRTQSILASGQLPDPKNVRTEEFVNAFPDSRSADPSRAFTVFCEGGPSPFGGNASSGIAVEQLQITIKARDLAAAERRPVTLTFAIDTSGSMELGSRLQAVRGALEILLDNLESEDRVGLIAYGTQPYLVLPHTSAREKKRILGAVDSLSALGSTNVEAGLDLAYRIADEVSHPRSVSRVVLCSDGVATSGARSADEILKKVRVYADRGIYLSVVGFGQERYDDAFLEKLANHGNGNYAYVDTVDDAARLFRDNLPAALSVLARDAKIQVEFDPAVVSQYRLLGYENRDVADKDFRNDAIDAGEVGPGSTVTAIYEIVRRPASSGSLGRVYLRYHDTTLGRVEELDFPIPPGVVATQLDHTTARFRLLSSVAELAELLRDSYFAKDGTFSDVLDQLNRLSPSALARPEVRALIEMTGQARAASLEQWSQ